MAEAVLGSKCKPHHACPLCHPFKAWLPWDVIINVIIFIGPSPGEVPGLSAPTTVEKRMLLENHYLFKQDKSFALIYSRSNFRIEETEIQWRERSCYRSQFSSVAQLCPTLSCDRMNCSIPGFPVQHQLPELVQSHVHWVSDAIQPSHPLSSPSPPAINLSQH